MSYDFDFYAFCMMTVEFSIVMVVLIVMALVKGRREQQQRDARLKLTREKKHRDFWSI